MEDALNQTHQPKVLLEANGLRKKFRIFKNFWFETKIAVDNVSLNVCEGEIVGMLGPNGAGKSTSLKMISGDLVPDEGSVYFDGQDVTDWPMYKRCNNGLGYMAQDNTLFKQMSVENNLLGVMQMQGFTRQDARVRCEELMEMFDLTRLRNNMAARLSGGEKRRLEVARALTKRPKMLILDEPFAGVDPKVIQTVQKLVVELRRNWGIAILITDHSVPNIVQLVDRCYVIAGPREGDKDDLTGGRVIFDGNVDDMMNDPAVRAAYLGDSDQGQATYVDANGRLHVRRKDFSVDIPEEQNDNSYAELPVETPTINSYVQQTAETSTIAPQNVVYNNTSVQYESEPSATQGAIENTSESSESTTEFETSENYQPEQASEKLAAFIPRPNENCDNNSSSESTMEQENTYSQEESITPQRKKELVSPVIKPFRRKN